MTEPEKGILTMAVTLVLTVLITLFSLRPWQARPAVSGPPGASTHELVGNR